ncbi:MAG: hypothetical protein IT381_23645 [Deltaproteobacteria bacterium]|nr:hypothetical protein [Deltaproteobacteria bacterium]
MICVLLLLRSLAEPDHEANPPVEWRGELQRAFVAQREQGLHLSTFGGRLFYRLARNGQPIDSGFFGYGLADVFEHAPESLPDVRRFQLMRWGAAITGAITVAAAVMFFLTASGFGRHELGQPRWIASVVGSGAGAVTFASVTAGLIIVAPMFLSHACQSHNEHVIGAALGAAL